MQYIPRGQEFLVCGAVAASDNARFLMQQN